MNRERLKKEINSLMKSMDFISDTFLKDGNMDEKEMRVYFNIYQQLGLAWEFLGLHCNHWDGFKITRDKSKACKICGKIRDVEEFYYLLPKNGLKRLGRKLRPNSKKLFKNKKEAEILDDTIEFHGATINVDVNNSYKTKLFGHKINIAADRIVKLRKGALNAVLTSV